MTKKLVSLLLTLALLCTASALAALETYRFDEDFSEFDLEVEIPEGALFQQIPQEGWLCLEIWYDDPEMPTFDITVSFSEEMAGRFLSELTEEECGHLMALASEDFSVPSQTLFVTPSGNTILLTEETDPDAGDYATMITIYKGFFFSLYCSHAEYEELIEADMQLMHQIIEGAWITDAGAGAQ